MPTPKRMQEVPKHGRDCLHDCVFLTLLVLVSVISYVGRLGFYIDDWGTLAKFRGSHDQTLLSLFRLLLYSSNMQARPVEVLYLTLLYKLFGLHPLGYHIMTAALLAVIACLFYLSLSLLNQPRFVAIAVSSVYILLPNYSTDRIWLGASASANLSMAFYFFNLYALLRAARTCGRSALAWAALSALALLGSALAYEVAMPLLVVNLLLARWQGGRKLSVKDTTDFSIGLALALVGNFVALAWLIHFKAKTTDRFHAESLSLSWVKYVVKGAIRVHFIDYGIRLPRILYLAVRLNPYWENYVLAGILALSVLLYAKGISDPDKTWMPASDTFKFMACGMLVFAAGNAVFLVTPREIGFATTGVVNRINIAASVGVAIIFVGTIRLFASVIGINAVRSIVESSLVALLCATGFLINNTVASFWSRAYHKQQEVLADIVQHIPSIPHGTTLVLDGVCPYMGPGIVFECFWDIGPALNILYHDWTLQGDVVSPRLQVEERALVTRIYGVTRYYPYSRTLMIYNFSRKLTEPLTNAETARRYFQTLHPTFRHDCSPGTEGYEVSIF